MSSCWTVVQQRPPVEEPARCFPGSQVWLQVSLQHTVTLHILLFVHGAEQLDGLLVDERPDVVEGDVLTALNAHLLQELTQALLALHLLWAGSRKSVSAAGNTQTH